ncbi:MAG: hypothetical protein HOK75_06780 [Phycisphaerae bacterium]|nr:hypothetical protein [Phycisphaerae bacterium]MBT7658162.1 hypothetical protein [Phycisphaerae bacterium]
MRKLVINDAKKSFDKSISKIVGLENVTTDVKWYGECWYWTVAFMSDFLEEPLAILVPAEENLQIAAPLTHDFIEQLSTRRLKRFVRDGLELALPPHRTNWAVWSIPTPAAFEDVLPVIKSKQKYYEA